MAHRWASRRLVGQRIAAVGASPPAVSSTAGRTCSTQRAMQQMAETCPRARVRTLENGAPTLNRPPHRLARAPTRPSAALKTTCISSCSDAVALELVALEPSSHAARTFGPVRGLHTSATSVGPFRGLHTSATSAGPLRRIPPSATADAHEPALDSAMELAEEETARASSAPIGTVLRRARPNAHAAVLLRCSMPCCCVATCRAALQHAARSAERGRTRPHWFRCQAQQCGSHHGGVPLPRVQPRERGRCTTQKPGRHLAVGLAWRGHVRSLRSAVDAEELHHGTGPLASDGACARLYRPRCTTRLRATDRTNEGSQQPHHREGPTFVGPALPRLRQRKIKVPTMRITVPTMRITVPTSCAVLCPGRVVAVPCS